MPSPVLSQRTLRIAAIVLGVSILIWLSLESRDVREALLLAGILSLLGAAAIWNRLPKTIRGYWLPMFGAVFGLLVPVLAALLMVLKTGMHAHSVPDFTLGQIFSVLQLIPVWVAVGAVLGLAAAWWHATRR
jgi:cell division protein FtsX